MSTLAPDIFVLLAQSTRSGQAIMKKQSPTDKEYFLQDWFEELVRDAGYVLKVQGRNSTPDFIVMRDGIIEGYELKSLKNTRQEQNPTHAPCRTDVDFNSSIPCGQFVKKQNHRFPPNIRVVDGTVMRCFYLFVLYEPQDELHVKGIALVLADGDYLNNDLELAEGHLNVSEDGFGSYGDAFIRVRKMYRFPNPLADPDFRYRTVFITQNPELAHNKLVLVLTKNKTEVKTKIQRRFYAYEAV